MNPNQGQTEAWNGGESVHYVSHADRYDRQLAPFTEALLEHVDLGPGDTVLDIGCGCGVTTLQAARHARAALGVDISHPLVRIATDRAQAAAVDNVEFVVADAQTHEFDEGGFDVVISQFGSMFFDDPEGAFANLRRALAPRGRAAFITWQELDANEWLMVVGRAVARHAELPDLGGRAGGPGMFALKHPRETTALLIGAGFTEVSVEPVSTTILLAGGEGLDESVDFLLGMGMVRGLLGRLAGDEREAALAEIRSTLAEHYEAGVGVRLGAAGWLASAHTPQQPRATKQQGHRSRSRPSHPH
ncbi:MAG TPA: methyltransferase domain-containing protein [Acidimicrobiales bacterium]|nr:methyltransferase domain-containing protein [Acidimicrobiales bacterium]